MPSERLDKRQQMTLRVTPFDEMRRVHINAGSAVTVLLPCARPHLRGSITQGRNSSSAVTVLSPCARPHLRGSSRNEVRGEAACACSPSMPRVEPSQDAPDGDVQHEHYAVSATALDVGRAVPVANDQTLGDMLPECLETVSRVTPV